MKMFEIQILRDGGLWECVKIMTVASSDYVKDYLALMESYMNYSRNNSGYVYRLTQVHLETRLSASTVREEK